ncbi:uncharacterized protein [Musca autumnalis]|uniref:uncharacterized protein n=1 Tax=Musca autumnalis TaxID=221902 RepID=UPI003CF26B70
MCESSKKSSASNQESQNRFALLGDIDILLEPSIPRAQPSQPNSEVNPNIETTTAPRNEISSKPSIEVPGPSNVVQTHHTVVAKKVMLATAWIKIISRSVAYKVRPLIDPCSDENFISEKVQKLLKLPTLPISAEVTGLGGQMVSRSEKLASFTIEPMNNQNLSLKVDALVVREVTGKVPSHSLNTIDHLNLPNITLADPDFYKSGPIDILLGGNLYPIILRGGVQHGILDTLVAQETIFGWIITGPSVSRIQSCCTRFKRNEKSLMRKPEFKTQYDEVMKEYLDLGHMVIDNESACDHNYYLPHHGVLKSYSTTTQLRVVFNGSSRSANGKSLNDNLYVGRTLQQDLVALITKWRFYEYVFSADITKMYRQILINPKQTNFQKIVFRCSNDEEIKDYRLNTVTFGISCAPYLALRTLLQLADDEEARFPIGAHILRNAMYVDDALVGSFSIEEALEARYQLIGILKSAKFELRK